MAIKLVCFDMDDTLLHQKSWYKLNLAFGVTPQEDNDMCEAYKNGTPLYEDWMRKLTEMYRARGTATKENALRALSNYTFHDGA